MRLIDADALKEEFRKIYHCAETAEELANTMDDAIDNAPTIVINTRKIEYEAYSKGLEDGKKIARSTDMTITEDLKE